MSDTAANALKKMAKTIEAIAMDFAKWLTDVINDHPADNQGKKYALGASVAQLFIDYIRSQGNTWKDHLIMMFNMAAHLPIYKVLVKLQAMVQRLPIKNVQMPKIVIDMCFWNQDTHKRSKALLELAKVNFELTAPDNTSTDHSIGL